MYISDVLNFMGLQYTIRGDKEIGSGVDISILDVSYSGGELTQELFDQAILDLMEFNDATLYKAKRQKEYPPIDVQLDMIYHDKIDGSTLWQDTITAIKLKYPKGAQ